MRCVRICVGRYNYVVWIVGTCSCRGEHALRMYGDGGRGDCVKIRRSCLGDLGGVR